uniref:Uncharacterized protein n=1 Tax=Podarcis muralis TaxID=64176 RepID=A0A670HXA5_PODMU
MVNILHLVQDHWAGTLVPIGFALGCYFVHRIIVKANKSDKRHLFTYSLSPPVDLSYWWKCF